RVELLVDRVQLLVGALQLLVGGDQLLVGRLHLLVGGLELLDRRLQGLAGVGELGLERGQVLARRLDDRHRLPSPPGLARGPRGGSCGVPRGDPWGSELRWKVTRTWRVAVRGWTSGSAVSVQRWLVLAPSVPGSRTPEYATAARSRTARWIAPDTTVRSSSS